MSNKHDLPHSTSIQFIDYDDDKNELHIRFVSGGTHCFKDCPKDHYEGLKASKSPGSYFHQNVRRKYESYSKG